MLYLGLPVFGCNISQILVQIKSNTSRVLHVHCSQVASEGLSTIIVVVIGILINIRLSLETHKVVGRPDCHMFLDNRLADDGGDLSRHLHLHHQDGSWY
jgi:hypothetical protein